MILLFHRILYLYIDMTLSLMFQLMANDKIYTRNSRTNGVRSTSVLCKMGKPENKNKINKILLG